MTTTGIVYIKRKLYTWHYAALDLPHKYLSISFYRSQSHDDDTKHTKKVFCLNRRKHNKNQRPSKATTSVGVTTLQVCKCVHWSLFLFLLVFSYLISYMYENLFSRFRTRITFNDLSNFTRCIFLSNTHLIRFLCKKILFS